MTFILQPWQLFFLILAGWINRYQQQVIDFYVSQTQALLESQGKKRILLSDVCWPSKAKPWGERL